ncbi:hypothetical protein SAMN05444920_117116 [Nonomuraea solani]|uniref:Uncharacterized protein n=1 Tax=Nonomuraea solani TaxID=1144553 RepID=A0A1H6EUT7_9ACTN|nr:hypothetical protein [Nonomuraea solani]SEH00685.1 hypothetical protein SAMN05444920_117116 [Nonomuraea solani]
MSFELPAALAPIELFLGRLFSDGDEDVLVQMGDEHDGHAVRMREHLVAGAEHVRGFTGANLGDGVTALDESFGHPEGPPRNLADAGTGSRVIGLGLKTSAGIVLAHKGITLFQYGLTAAALAETLATGGAMAPFVRQAGQRAVDAVANVTVNELLS